MIYYAYHGQKYRVDQLGFIVPLGHCSTSIFDCPTFEMQKIGEIVFSQTLCISCHDRKRHFTGAIKTGLRQEFRQNKNMS